MSEQLNTINPPLDELEHHGVKGMHWGVRSRSVTLNTGKRSSFPSTKTIKTARKTVASQQKALRIQKKAVRKAPTPQSKSRQQSKLASMKVAALKNPDRVTALKLTKGEHALAAVLLLAPGPNAGLLTTLGAREVTARVVSSRQASGYYNKKK